MFVGVFRLADTSPARARDISNHRVRTRRAVSARVDGRSPRSVASNRVDPV